MIIYGKRLNKKKMCTLDKMYTIQGKGEDTSILLAHAGVSLADRIKDLKIQNAIIRQETNCWRIWIGPRKRFVKQGGYYYRQNAVDFEHNITVVDNGVIQNYSKLCYVCKDKMKGIVDECTQKSHWNNTMEKCCNFDLTIKETDIDLSSMREVSNGLLNSHSAFRNDSHLSEISFSWPIINKNVEAYKARATCSKVKPKKIKNHCSRCVFDCSSKLITSSNIGNKCCLTYDQAIKSGFFKDMKIKVTTSIYNNGVFVDGAKIGGWGDKITGEENKYVKFKEKQTKEETHK